MAAVQVEDLSRGLRAVTFGGEDLIGRAWTPGQELQVDVAPGVRRHYTPATFDAGSGLCCVIFQLLVPGPGTTWARRLTPGVPVTFRGPLGGVRSLPSGVRAYLGDATALGAIRALIDDASGPAGSQTACGAVEVAPHDTDAARHLLPELIVLPHDGAPGGALGRWVAGDLTAAAGDAGRAALTCHLIGHANSLRELRRRLATAGVPRRSVALKPYWATGRCGL